MAAGPNGPNLASSNPRKFSEKIALQRQRQAEETAAFEEVMMDLTSTRVKKLEPRMQAQKLKLAHARGPYYGGSLPNVNQIGSSSSEFHGAVHSPLDSRSTRHHGLVERAQRDPRRVMSSLRRYMRQTVLPTAQPSFPHLQSRAGGGLQDEMMDSKVFPFQVPSVEETFLQDSKHLLKPWDTKKFPAGSARPKSCEVPGINIYPSLDQPSSVSLMPSLLNSGGSLPDLTTLHFPPPLPTPLDPDESSYSSLSGGSSTSNLTSTMTNLGIDGSLGLAIGYNSGFTSPLQSSLSNPSLQSSLSHPNLQSSLSSQSLQSSLSNPSLRSSLSSTSMPSSMSNPSIQSSTSNPSLSSSLSNPSLGSPSIQTSPTNPSLQITFSSASYSPMVNSPTTTSPRRRVPLSPLILPLGGDTRRQHSKQFSPTVPPTLSSITQGVPLDTSQLPVDQRLPPYPFNQSNPLLQSQQPLMPQNALHQSQQPLQRTSLQQLTQSHQQNHGPQHHYSELQHHQQQQQHQHHHPESRHPLHHEQHLPFQEEQHAHLQEQQHQHHQEEHQPHHQQELSNLNPHQQQQTQLKQEQQHMRCQEQSLTHHYQEQTITDNQQDQQHEVRQQGPKQEHPDQHQPCQAHAQSPQPVRANRQTLRQYGFPQYLQSPYNHAIGDYNLGSFEQFNMVDSISDGLQLNNNAFLGSSGDYDYHPSVNLSMNEDNSHFHDPLSLNKQNLNNCTRHGNIPNIILTGDSPPGFSKEITSALAGVPGFEVDPSLDLDEELRIEPLTLDGLHMLSDPYALLTDPSVEDSFRTDRLQ